MSAGWIHKGTYYRNSHNGRLKGGIGKKWLDTQTWSYKAIGVYMDVGFVPMKTATFSEVPKEYQKAASVMTGKMRDDKYRQFMGIAEVRK